MIFFIRIFVGADFQAAASLGMSGLHVSYYQRCSEQLQVGVDMDTSLRSGESVGSVAYSIDIPKANVTFKGTASLTFSPCLSDLSFVSILLVSNEDVMSFKVR